MAVSHRNEDNNYSCFALYFAGARRLPAVASQHKKILLPGGFLGWAHYL